MKRIVPILLIAVLLCGCSRGVPLLNPVEFYYLRTEYVYGTADGVVASETHESSGHVGDVEHLLYLYFLGPVEEGLVNPFPEGIELLSAEQNGDGILIELSDPAPGISDLHFSLACTCLSMTCMSIVPIQSVTVVCGSRTVTTNRDSILSLDDYMQH